MSKLKEAIKKVIPTSMAKSNKLYSNLIQEIANMQARVIPKTMLDYEVQLVEHCNLNCKCCSHFSPLCKEEFLDVEEYRKDCKRLSELFNGQANFIRLMGGEPLLHPEIEKILEITKENFPKSIIDLDTNGILVLSMKKEFWESMRKTKINLTITRYPIKLNYEKIKEKCKKEKVNFRFFDEQKSREFTKLSLDIEARQQTDCNFIKCYLANSCHTLKHGKMYTCSTVPHISHFNEYYKCNLEITEKDGIDIYKAKSGQEILDFLAKPIPFCRYCKVNQRVYGNKWQKSEKSIDEWT